MIPIFSNILSILNSVKKKKMGGTQMVRTRGCATGGH